MTREEKKEYCNSRIKCDEGYCMYAMGEYDNETGEHIQFCVCDFDIDDEGKDYDNNN